MKIFKKLCSSCFLSVLIWRVIPELKIKALFWPIQYIAEDGLIYTSYIYVNVYTSFTNVHILFIAEFKDSLGKIKVSCLSNPRQTIDVDMNFESDMADRSMNSKDIARKRKIQLGALEKVITFVCPYLDHYIVIYLMYVSTYVCACIKWT